MSDKKKRFASIYGAKKPILAHQYLVELIVKRRADKQNIQLPNQWWLAKFKPTYDYWTKLWNYETKFIKPLLEKYDAQCLIDAFTSFDCKDVLSAKNPKLEKVAKEFQRRKDILDATKEEVNITITATNIVPRKQKGKTNRLSKLRDE